MAWRGGTDHEPGRYPDLAAPQAAKVARGAARPAAPSHATEPTHAGHPRRRPVGRRARCADVVAATAAARGQRAGRALQRGSRVEVGRTGRVAGGLLQAAACRARAGAATAGRSWPGHREIEAAGDGRLRGPGHDPNDALRKEAEAAAASSVFFRSGAQKAAPVAQSQVAAARASPPMRRSTRWRLGRPRRRPSLPTRPPYRTGKTRKGFPERWFHGNP